MPYGVNNSNRGTGVLPDLLSGPTPKVIRFDTARNVALFSPEIEVPLQPFMGIMAVAPSRELVAHLLAPAVALGRQHGLQQAHSRSDALSAGVP